MAGAMWREAVAGDAEWYTVHHISVSSGIRHRYHMFPQYSLGTKDPFSRSPDDPLSAASSVAGDGAPTPPLPPPEPVTRHLTRPRRRASSLIFSPAFVQTTTLFPGQHDLEHLTRRFRCDVVYEMGGDLTRGARSLPSPLDKPPSPHAASRLRRPLSLPRAPSNGGSGNFGNLDGIAAAAPAGPISPPPSPRMRWDRLVS
jgi:hypothetical protein